MVAVEFTSNGLAFRLDYSRYSVFLQTWSYRALLSPDFIGT